MRLTTRRSRFALSASAITRTRPARAAITNKSLCHGTLLAERGNDGSRAALAHVLMRPYSRVAERCLNRLNARALTRQHLEPIVPFYRGANQPGSKSRGQTAESSALVCRRPVEPAPGNAGEGKFIVHPFFLLSRSYWSNLLGARYDCI